MTSTSADLSALLRGAAAATAEPARFDDPLTMPFERRRVVRRASDRATFDAASARSFTEVVEEARAAAHEEGWAAGHAAGLDAAEHDVRRRQAEKAAQHRAAEADRADAVARALVALDAAAADLRGASANDSSALLELALNSALELAEALVGHDIAARGTPALDAVRRALAAAPHDADVVVRLHPADAAVVADLATDGGLPDGLRVVADDRVAPGDCIAEAGAVQVDASVRAALARAREVLLP